MRMWSKLSKKGRNSTSSNQRAESFPPNAEQTRGITNAANKLSIGAEDVVIAIMGVTGTGKSTFIEQLTQSGVQVGHTLRSCTIDVGVHAFRYRNGQKIYLIDTPGFNDTTRSDTQVLTDIAYFLGAAYSIKIKLAGIICLHRITDARMGGSALKNLHMFKALCGSASLSNVVLATTMWDTLQDPEAIKRGQRIEKELRKEGDFWGDMVDMGSEMFRHYGNPDSALRIVDYIMQLKGYVVLDIQREMVDNNRTLNETTAGKEVQRELLAAKKKYDEEIKAYKESTKAAIEAGNQKMADKLAEMEAKSQKKLDDANKQTRQLHGNFAEIKKEGDERAEKMIADLKAEQARNAQIAADREREINALAEKQRKYEEEIENQKQINANKDVEWTARMTQMNVEAERDRREMKRKREEREAAIAQQTSTDGKIAIFKMIAGAAMTGLGAWTLNPVLAGAGSVLLGTSTKTTQYVKPY